MSVQALLAARHNAFERSGGKIGPAAAHLAEQIEFDEQLRNAAATLRQVAIDSGAETEEEILELTRCSPVYVNGVQMPGTGTPSDPIVARRLRERKLL